jgi:hypothetical protein
MSETRMCVGRARLVIWEGGWRVVPAGELADGARDANVALELQTDPDGCLLIMTPDGGFTADDWFPSERAALESAHERFGAPLDGWTPKT